MIEIRNLLFQPLTFQLSGSSGSIHLCSRERKILRCDQISAEIRSAASRGFVTLTEIAEAGPEDKASVASESSGTDKSTDAADSPTRKRR